MVFSLCTDTWSEIVVSLTVNEYFAAGIYMSRANEVDRINWNVS